MTTPSTAPALVRPQPGPATLKQTRWGGRRLGPLRGAPAGVAIGESWELSTLPGAASRAEGRDLSEVLGGPLPFLAKLIDTAAALSIQVHPDDDPVTGRPGKEEAWIVLDAEPGAQVLAGVAAGIDDASLRAAMEQAIAAPDHDSVLIDALVAVPVQRGTVIVVPAGTVHAIGPGILLAEIQQPVDCTFRLFDYGSGREIHPEQAAAAWRVDARPEIWRPDEAPRTLHGRHVQLEIHTGKTVGVEADSEPQLLVAVGGEVDVDAGGQTLRMGHGDLVLHTRGRGEAQLDAGAMLVVGRLAP